MPILVTDHFGRILRFPQAIACGMPLLLTYLHLFSGIAFGQGVKSTSEVLKDFVSNPPVVSNLLFHQFPSASRGHTAPTNGIYVLCRWQTNAFLWLQFDSLEDAHSNVLDKATRGWANYDSNYWSYSRNSGVTTYMRTGKSALLESSNGVVKLCNGALENLSRPLNIGIPNIPIGTIKWIGDTFTATNDNYQFVRSGTLKLSNGIPEELQLNGESARAGPLRAKLRYRYESSRAQAVYPLPTTIEFSSQGGASQIVQMLLLDVSVEPLPQRCFSLNQLMSTNAYRISYDGTTRLFEGRDGTKVPIKLVPPGTPTSGLRTAFGRLIFCVTTLGPLLAWLVWTIILRRSKHRN